MIEVRRRRFLKLAGFSGAGGLLGSEANAASRTHVVTITGFVFQPAYLEVRQGDSVSWVNKDIAPHTATGDGMEWDTGEIKFGDTVTLEVNQWSDTSYHCVYHPAMKAIIKVIG